MTTLTSTGLVLAEVRSTDALEATGENIPVDLPTTTYRMVYRLVMGAVNPGDLLDISASARVTNDNNYTIGVGWHVWMYDYNNPLKTNGPWTQISQLNGDNVDLTRHHMPVHTSCLYRMPDTWPAGHRPVVTLRVDAHSTAWKAGDTLTTDAGYGQLITRRWTTPAV